MKQRSSTGVLHTPHRTLAEQLADIEEQIANLQRQLDELRAAQARERTDGIYAAPLAEPRAIHGFARGGVGATRPRNSVE